MAYYVDVMPMALEDAQDALGWMEQHSPKHADEWYAGLLDAIFSLEEMPRRCGLAYENDDVDEELRQLLYTSRRVVYRILFTILQDAAGEQEGHLRVLRIRHSAQRPLTPRELKQSMQE